jgi:hypothetical protein
MTIKINRPKIRRVILGLFFLLAVIFLNFVVPPFQNPDEPHHFVAVMIYAVGEAEKAEVGKELIRLMDKHNWWKLTGLGLPVELIF